MKQEIARYRGRVQVYPTPTHASWLNIVELFFAEISRNVIRRGNFESIPDWQEKRLAWMDWRNENAQPYSGPAPVSRSQPSCRKTYLTLHQVGQRTCTTNCENRFAPASPCCCCWPVWCY
ncbi:MAG: hypothetical protein HS108_15610 [Planctomycetes bacterium]|nr:hypothetical protein [Planctomycetota bacterium]MCL4731686.1 hypothetical protein [Planctomycetota bacterium]